MADCYLPEEILIEILSRLSVKSLLRIRCVCKTWRDLVSNPSFVTKHLAENTDLNNKEQRLIILQRDVENRPDDLEEHFRREQNNMSRTTTIILHVKPLGLDNTMNYAGSCNGLICILHHGEFMLWNPATHQRRYLPRPGICVPYYHQCSLGLTLGFGFAFNPYTKDYKLVRFFSKTCRDLPRLQYCEVYSKFTDSWRKIIINNDDSQCNCRVGEQSWPSAVVSGRIHWKAYKYDRTHVILSFDMGKEVFQEISLPDFSGFRFKFDDPVAVVDDCLAVIVYDDDMAHTSQCTEVWVMKEYGVHESWTKLIKIGPFTGIIKPLFYFKNGVFILENTKNELFLYDSNIQKFGKLPVLSPSSSRYIFAIHTYTESLVSVQGGYY